MSTWQLISQVRERVRQEEGTLRKQASLRVALCCPSPYSVGMSSLGYQTIYREIHLHPDASAERAFLPDDVEAYRGSGMPLVSYETETPVANFPILAFSVSYELEIPGMLEMLELCGIPLLASERTGRHPLVVCGGPLTNSNPVPLSPFADLIILGEAEELIHTFLDAVTTMKRGDLLDYFASLNGCYVPGRSPQVPQIAKAQDDRLPARSQILTKNMVLTSIFLIEPEPACS